MTTRILQELCFNAFWVAQIPWQLTMSSYSGRPIGIPMKQRDTAMLSTNPHTQRERERRAKKSGLDKRIDNAKRADSAAWDYAKKKLKATAKYINASEQEQEDLLKSKKEELMQQRLVSSSILVVIIIKNQFFLGLHRANTTLLSSKLVLSLHGTRMTIFNYHYYQNYYQNLQSLMETSILVMTMVLVMSRMKMKTTLVVKWKTMRIRQWILISQMTILF